MVQCQCGFCQAASNSLAALWAAGGKYLERLTVGFQGCFGVRSGTMGLRQRGEDVGVQQWVGLFASGEAFQRGLQGVGGVVGGFFGSQQRLCVGQQVFG